MSTPVDFATIRGDFPVADRMLYLDSAHQTPLAGSVRAAFDRFLDESSENAGPKPAWLRRVEKTRERIAGFIGAGADELAFTKNTSEGLNIAANALPLREGDNVLMIAGDHPNNAYAWLNLRKKGVKVRFVELASEVAGAETFARYIDDRTRAISLSHVTFHAGQRHDIGAIGALCRQCGIPLIVDAMQSVGVLPIDVKALGVSMLAAGCHKGLLVPQGLGILYVDRHLDGLDPAYLGLAGLANPPADLIADPSDLSLRAGAGRFELGNLNLPGIHALDAALDIVTRLGIVRIEQHMLALGDHLIAHLDRLGIGLVGPRSRVSRAHIYVLDLPVDDTVEHLSRHNARVSPERSGVRISFGIFNTLADVDRLADLLGRRGTPHAVNPPLSGITS